MENDQAILDALDRMNRNLEAIRAELQEMNRQDKTLNEKMDKLTERLYSVTGPTMQETIDWFKRKFS